MFYGQRIAVVIPAYRVEQWVDRVIETIPDYVDLVVIVDDASPDQTGAIATGAGDPRVTVIRHSKNTGVGGAMKTGFRYALEAGADVIVKMDGDGQMDPAYLPGLIYPIVADECDYTKGNRFGWVSETTKMPIIRKLGNQTLTFMTKMSSGYWHVFDPQNGYFAVRADYLRRVRLNEIDDGYFFENSMLINLNIVEARVADVHIPARYGEETSSLRIGRVVLVFPFKLIRGFFRRVFYRYVYLDVSPVALMLALGAILVVGGAALGGISWYNSIVTGRPVALGTVALGLAPLLMGFQLLTNAILLDIQQSPRGPRKSYHFSREELDGLAVAAAQSGAGTGGVSIPIARGAQGLSGARS